MSATLKEAVKRLEKYGINEIEKRKRITPLQIFARQFTSFINRPKPLPLVVVP